MDSEPRYTTDDYIAQGDRRMKHGDPGNAICYYRSAVQSYNGPESPPAFLFVKLGVCYSAIKDPCEWAEECYQVAERLVNYDQIKVARLLFERIRLQIGLRKPDESTLIINSPEMEAMEDETDWPGASEAGTGVPVLPADPASLAKTDILDGLWNGWPVDGNPQWPFYDIPNLADLTA